MEVEQIRQIVTYALKWLVGTSGGMFILGWILKIVKSAIENRKPVVLNEKSCDSISNRIAGSLSNGIEVDISEQVDKATNKRIDTLEKQYNDLIELFAHYIKGQKAVMKGISEMRSISNETRISLLECIDNAKTDENKAKTTEIEVAEKPIAKIEKTEENANSDLY